MLQRGLAMSAFGIVARAEFPAAKTVRQGGSDFVQKLRSSGLPDQILIAGSVDHVGTAVAVKMGKAFAHAAGSPCPGRMTAFRALHNANPLRRRLVNDLFQFIFLWLQAAVM